MSGSRKAAKADLQPEEEEAFTIDALGRKKWDKEFYRKQAEDKERLKEAQKPARPTSALQREKHMSLEEVEKLRKPDGLLNCDICEVSLRDPQAFIDHINGKAHNRALGMTMTVKKATPEEVKDKLLAIRKRLYPEEQ